MVGGLVEAGDHIVYEWMVIPGTLRFDKVVHAFGFGFATLACYELLRPSYGGTDRGAAAFAALAGLGLGALNEMVEFLIARYSASSNVGGFTNTGWDLVFNTIGATIAAAYCVARPRVVPDEDA
jgi:putative membrane protein